MLYRRSLAFIFAPLLQKQLDEFREYLNTHWIRHNHQADCPSGAIPNDLYDMPDHVGNTIIFRALHVFWQSLLFDNVSTVTFLIPNRNRGLHEANLPQVVV